MTHTKSRVMCALLAMSALALALSTLPEPARADASGADAAASVTGFAATATSGDAAGVSEDEGAADATEADATDAPGAPDTDDATADAPGDTDDAAADSAGAVGDNANPAAVPAAPAPVTIQLSTIGSKDTDQARTRQYLQFENADWTGLYIRPGIHAKFKITLETNADNPNVLTAYRQAGHADKDDPQVVVARDGTVLKKGENDVTLDTTGNTVGQLLLVRNDGGQEATVKIESMDADNGVPSLGAYPMYTYDPDHPEKFWDYLQDLRAYQQTGLATDTNNLVDHPNLGMNVTSLTFGRMVYDLRASKMVSSLATVTTKYQAEQWATNAYNVSEGRLDYFDGLLGFDANDTDARQKPTEMKVVLELTDNLTNPSTMFAWFTMYHLGDSDYSTTWPRLATDVDSSHGWGNDHEFGHMVELAPLAIPEETNNLIAMYGRREASIVAKNKYGTPFNTNTYHGGALDAQKAIDAYLNDVLAGNNPDSQWKENEWSWFGMQSRFNMIHWFDDYDYADYDFDSSPFTKDQAEQVKKYGGLGAVYRQVRSHPDQYGGSDNLYQKVNASARAYSDALGFDMSEVMGRYGMELTNETKAYTAKYPKLDMNGVKIQYFSLDADARAINGAQPFGADASAPTLTASTDADGKLTVTASYAAGTAEAASASGYELRADGKPVSWQPGGTFTFAPVAGMTYTVVAYDVRAYPSPAATVPGTAAVHKVTFDSQGGSDVAEQEVTDGEKATEPTPAPTKVGFTLDGWYTQPNGAGDKWNFSANTVTKDVTLYAKWIENAPATFTVTIYPGNDDSEKTETVESGKTLAEPDEPSWPGHKFAGWYVEDEQGNGTKYNFDDPVTKDFTLYGYWIELTYTVTFDVNGGDAASAPAPQTAKYNQLINAVDAPTRDGYEFAGWNTASDGSGDAFDFQTSRITDNLTLYAQWTAKAPVTPDPDPDSNPKPDPDPNPKPEPEPTTWKVTFVYGVDGYSDATVEVKDGDTVARPDDPAYDGWRFVGWFTQVDEADGIKRLSGEYDFSTPVTGDLTLYAGWVPAGESGGDDQDVAPEQPGATEDSSKKLPQTGDETNFAVPAAVAAVGVVAVVAAIIVRGRSGR